MGKPVVVLSNNDGCAVARSNEAKALDIKMGTPIFQLQDFVRKNKLVWLSSNYALYGDTSNRVMQTLYQFTPKIERYSIDEAFLVLDGFNTLNLTDYCKYIRQTVKQNTGIPVSIGIGQTKTLAKIANKIAKKNPKLDGVFDITQQTDIDELLKGIEVGDIWMIGYRHTAFLNSFGIHTAFELKYANDGFIKKNMTVTGLRTVWELRGTPCIPLEEITPPKKAIVSSRSFGRPVESLNELKEALASYVCRAVSKLQRQDSLASIIQVFIATNPFKEKEPQYSNSINLKLSVPTSDTSILLHTAHDLLEKIFKPGYRYKRTGILLTDFIPDNQITFDMFVESKRTDRNKELWKAIKDINQRWGKDTVRVASAGIKQPWKMRQARRTQRYTTQWDELLTVQTG